MYILLDLLISNITNINSIIFIINLYYINPINFIYSILIFILFNNSVYDLFILLIIYISENTLKRYTNYNLISRLISITFYYLILYTINLSYLINILLVIIIDLFKYNYIGDKFGTKEILKKPIK